MKAILKSVVNSETMEPRTDKFYSEITGAEIDLEFGLPVVGGILYGCINDRFLRTSTVKSVDRNSDEMTVTTRNTIYVLQLGGNA